MMKFILFAVLSACALSAFAGPESGGGGNVCASRTLLGGSDWTALDLVNGAGVNHSVRLGLRFADRIRFTPAEEQQGLKVLSASSKLLRGVEIVLEDLRKAGETKTADEILKSIRDLKMVAVPRLPGARSIGADFRDTQPACTSANTQAAILYDWKIGIVVSALIWNQLSETTQVTLLIHEGLRNIQIRYRYGFSNYALQLLTQKLMAGQIAPFTRLFAASRVHGVVTTDAARARLCKAKSQEIAGDLSAYTKNNGVSRPERLLTTYLNAACRTGRAEDIWKLMDFVLSDLDMEDMWQSWGLTDEDFSEFNDSIVNAYNATDPAEHRDLAKTWEEVRQMRVMMWAAPIALEGKPLLDPSDIRRYQTMIRESYARAK